MDPIAQANACGCDRKDAVLALLARRGAMRMEKRRRSAQRFAAGSGGRETRPDREWGFARFSDALDEAQEMHFGQGCAASGCELLALASSWGESVSGLSPCQALMTFGDYALAFGACSQDAQARSRLAEKKSMECALDGASHLFSSGTGAPYFAAYRAYALEWLWRRFGAGFEDVFEKWAALEGCQALLAEVSRSALRRCAPGAARPGGAAAL